MIQLGEKKKRKEKYRGVKDATVTEDIQLAMAVYREPSGNQFFGRRRGGG